MSKRFTYYGGIETSLLPYLTAYWTADNIATDVHINNLGGFWVGDANYNTGINGQSFDFGNDSVNRYVVVADNDLLSATDGVQDLPFTWRFWIKFDGFSAVRNFMIWKSDISTSREYFFSYDTSNGFQFQKCSQGVITNRVETKASFTTNFNTWYYIAITSDGSKFGEKIYIDGVDLTSSTTEIGTYVKMNNTSEYLTFGTLRQVTTDRKHLGQMDEIAWFRDYEMTPLEVLTDYNLGIGKFYPNI